MIEFNRPFPRCIRGKRTAQLAEILDAEGVVLQHRGGKATPGHITSLEPALHNVSIGTFLFWNPCFQEFHDAAFPISAPTDASIK